MNGTDNGQGNPGDQNLDNSGTGVQGNEGSQNQGSSANQGGQPSATWEEKEKQYQQQIKSLNRAVIEARRQQRQPQNNTPQGQDYSAFDDPAGQYAISLELATGQLSRKLEDIYSLYPEVPATEITRIRRNPWAFASLESYKAGDVETAMLEIEQALLDRATELGQSQQNPTQNGQANPAQINPNQPQENVADQEPGSDEDENPWTMPLDKLEKKAKKELVQRQTKS